MGLEPRQNIDDYKDFFGPDLRIRKRSFDAEVSRGGLPLSESVPVGRADSDIPYLGDAIYLSGSFQGFNVSIGTTPTLILSNAYTTPYLILNPARTLGLTTTIAAVPSTTTGVVGNSQANSIGVSGYSEAHIIVNITANAGTWSFYQQAFDPINLAWVDAQTLVNAAVGTGSFYNFVGSFGVATDMAFRWDFAAAGNITFDITVILKAGTGGSAGGFAQTVFIGNSGVSTVSGFPILEGGQQKFVVGENVDLYGISTSLLDLRVFRLK